MGIFQNSGFYGSIGSVKKSLQGYMEHFKSGFNGYGWKLWKSINGKYKFEIDDIVVRGSMYIFELIVQKLRAVKGSLAVSQGSEKIVKVEEFETEYALTIEADMCSILDDDYIRCEVFRGSKRFYHVLVSRADGRVIYVDKSEFEGYDLPQVDDDIVQFGNKTNKARQSCIYLHADESGQPAIDIMFGIDSKDWSGKTKISLGGEIPGGDGARGLYCENGMILCMSEKGDVVYRLSPTGAINLGKGAIVYNPVTNKMTLGDNVKITWSNLDDDCKQNLKGESGKWVKSIYSYRDTKPRRPLTSTYLSEGWSDTPDNRGAEKIMYSHLTTYKLDAPTIDLPQVWSLIDGWMVSPPRMPYGACSKAKVEFTTTRENQVVEFDYILSCEALYDLLLVGRVDSTVGKDSYYESIVCTNSEVEKRGVVKLNISRAGKHYIEFGYYTDQSGEYGRNNAMVSFASSNTCWISQSTCSYVSGGWLPSEWSEPQIFIADTSDSESIYWRTHLDITPLSPNSEPKYDEYIPTLKLDSQYSEKWEPGLVVTKGMIFIHDGVYYESLSSFADVTFPTTEVKQLNGWTDNPSGVTSSERFEFISIRKRRDGVWSEFSTPALWSKINEERALDWLDEWNSNTTEIDGKSVVSPRMFSGTRGENGKLTGVAFGRDVIEIGGVKYTGVFGIKDGKTTFSINSETGDTRISGNVDATSGRIGGWDINGSILEYKKDISNDPEKPSYVTSNIGAGKMRIQDLFGYTYFDKDKANGIYVNIEKSSDYPNVGFSENSTVKISGYDTIGDYQGNRGNALELHSQYGLALRVIKGGVNINLNNGNAGQSMHVYGGDMIFDTNNNTNKFYLKGIKDYPNSQPPGVANFKMVVIDINSGLLAWKTI